ncbi:MAG TPA: cytochrome c [Pyrinomonadaceae bacterium]|jgi:mono/diheme cytochrome c family protein
MPRAGDFKRALSAAAAACLALAAAAGCDTRANKPAPPAAGAAAARTTYERSCAACHGAQGEGKQLGTLRVPTLREGAAVNDPDERLFSQISDGGKGMPPFKHTFDDRQIQDLVRFIREEFQGKR